MIGSNLMQQGDPKGQRLNQIVKEAQDEIFRISGEKRPFTSKEREKIARYVDSGQQDPKKLARAIDMLRDDDGLDDFTH